jgi:hypothetical protein
LAKNPKVLPISDFKISPDGEIKREKVWGEAGKRKTLNGKPVANQFHEKVD